VYLVSTTVSIIYVVDRVIDFFSSRPNWDHPSPPTTSPAGECSPSLFSGGEHKLAGEGVGGPISDKGQTLYSRYGIYRWFNSYNCSSTVPTWKEYASLYPEPVTGHTVGVGVPVELLL
jgi:hypothetical protein